MTIIDIGVVGHKLECDPCQFDDTLSSGTSVTPGPYIATEAGHWFATDIATGHQSVTKHCSGITGSEKDSGSDNLTRSSVNILMSSKRKDSQPTKAVIAKVSQQLSNNFASFCQ